MNFRFWILDFGLVSRPRSGDQSPAPKSKIENPKSKVGPGSWVLGPRSAAGSGKTAGFSLLEVLIALALFAMVAVVLGASYLNVLNSYETVSRAMQVNEDFAYARQLVMTEPDRTKLENGGDFDATGGRRAHWEVTVESTNLADVFKVTLICELADPNRPQPDKLEQVFTLLRPTWSIDAAERSKLKEETKTKILQLQGKLAR
jgi:general secretion pathway protein I